MRDGIIDENAKCQVMILIEDRYVIVDGLNGNVDVFSQEKFDYICTIDINEEKVAAAYYSSEIPN